VIAAVLSAVVSAVFAGVLALRYARRRRPHQLVWTIGLAMFTLAAAAGVLARSGGATEAEYRLFYLFGAILNVAWLALGTTYLLAPRAARRALWGLLAFTALASVAVFASPVDLSAAADTGKGFDRASSPGSAAAWAASSSSPARSGRRGASSARATRDVARSRT